MSFSATSQAALKVILIGLGLSAAIAAPSAAYTGGPARAYIAGLEPASQRVFYYFIFHDETTSGPQVWYFDLDGGEPTRPVRALSLEGRDDGIRNRRTGISDAWRAFSPDLVPLTNLPQIDLRISLEADSAGTHPTWNTPRYHGQLVVEAQGSVRAVHLVFYCNSLIRVQGVYGIPGRKEVIVVVSYKGRAYGCEEVDLPILLVPHRSDINCLRSRNGVPGSDDMRQEPGQSRNVRAMRDPFQPVTWYMTMRNTTKQYDEHISFDIEFYFGKQDDGDEFVRFRTGYRNRRSDQHNPEWLHYNNVLLTDDAGHYFEARTWPQCKQVSECPQGFEEWSDRALVEPWGPEWARRDRRWQQFADSKVIHARFEGMETYDFDLTPDQVAAIREVVKHFNME